MVNIIRQVKSRRSYLFVPLSSEKFIGKAVNLENLDAVILDLEDGVSPDEKSSARDRMAVAAAQIKASGKDIFVRVNDPGTPMGICDLLALDLRNTDAVLLPKATEKSILVTDSLLDYLETVQEMEPGRTEIAIMVETGEGLMAAERNLHLSKRITTLAFGAEDYSNDLGIRKEESEGLINYARYRLVTLARMNGLEAVDSPCTNFRDKEFYEKAIIIAKKQGFTGKCSIHPVMIGAINSCFSPTEEEVEEARAVWDAYEHGIREHKGAISLNGLMIDKPIAEKARKTLQRAGIPADL